MNIATFVYELLWEKENHRYFCIWTIEGERKSSLLSNMNCWGRKKNIMDESYKHRATL